MAIMKHRFQRMWIPLLFLCSSHGFCPEINDTDIPGKVKIHRKLLKYPEIVKPGAYNDMINIQVVLRPTYLQQLDTAKLIFSIVGMLDFYWHHESLAWKPDDYGGVFEIRLPADKIWKPEFKVRNSAVSNIFEESILDKHKVYISWDGHASWLVSEMFTTSCKINPDYFPFDAQQCQIDISGEASRVENFTALGVDNMDFIKSTEWSLLDSYASNVDDPSNNETTMSFRFKFKRRPDFYIVTMIMPLIILSILGLLTFLLPTNSGEKISLGMACLLSFVVIQASVTPYLPTSYFNMPYIVMLNFALMVFNALSFSTTIIMISVLSMEPHPRMPGWLDRLVCKSGKVKRSPNVNPQIKDVNAEIEDADAIQKSQRFTAEIRKCSGCPGNPEQEQLDVKWKEVAHFTNNCLFLLFSITFVILICTIFVAWLLGAESAS